MRVIQQLTVRHFFKTFRDVNLQHTSGKRLPPPLRSGRSSDRRTKQSVDSSPSQAPTASCQTCVSRLSGDSEPLATRENNGVETNINTVGRDPAGRAVDCTISCAENKTFALLDTMSTRTRRREGRGIYVRLVRGEFGVEGSTCMRTST